MARLHHVQRAAKAYPKEGIKKGEPYYWWQFRSGGRGMGRIIGHPKRRSKTRPRRSQLTQSAYLGQLYDIEDAIAALSADSGLGDAIEEIAGRLDELAGEQQEKLDNMPEALQSAPTGEMLNERKEACEQAAEELRQIDADADNKDAGVTEEEFWEAARDEVQAVSIGG